MEHNTLFFLGNEREFNIETKEFLEISIIIFHSIWNAIFFSLSRFLSFIIIYKFQKLLRINNLVRLIDLLILEEVISA